MKQNKLSLAIWWFTAPWALVLAGLLISAVFVAVPVLAEADGGKRVGVGLSAASDVAPWLLLWLQNVFFVQTRGILFRNRRRKSSIEMSASLTAMFSCDKPPQQSDLVVRLRERYAHHGLRVIEDKAQADGGIGRLHMFLPRLGERIELGSNRIITGAPSDLDELTSITLTVPAARRTVVTIERLIEDGFSELVTVLEPMLGSPDGLRMDAQFVAMQNPYYGVVLRSGISSSDVAEFRARITPSVAARSEEILIERDGVHLSAANERDFKRGFRQYIGFEGPEINSAH